VTRALTPRARIAPRPEPPFDRLFDPVVDELVRGGPLARERFPTLWRDRASVARLAERKRRPLPAALVDELIEYHHRLGAGSKTFESIERLRRGEAVCSVAGQQPGPLGGPLYSLHKTASSVALASIVAEETGSSCVPLFWMHGEDSDFVEIRSAAIADRALTVHELLLPGSAHHDGGLVGSVPSAPVAELSAHALGIWNQLPFEREVTTLLSRTLGAARDLGESYSALMLELFRDSGLLVIDPRLPSFRAAARPLIDRYLERAPELASAARAGGELLERRIGRRPLADAALDSFVFAIEDGTRRKVSADEARRVSPHAALSPSVALRAVIQDGVFPTVAMACGAAEISYLAQLREVFESLAVEPSAPVPRLTATWIPPAAVELLEASGADAWELVTGADQVLKGMAERQVPSDVRGELERARSESLAALERFGASAQRVDPSLPQMVDSARGKVDYQFARLLDGVTGKVRHRLERQHPEWLRLRYYLMPGDRLQERRIASLDVVVHRGVAAVRELCDLAEEQARSLIDGVHTHLVLELE
jgi:uncharacterized protein YllA (UPF0747 family)